MTDLSALPIAVGAKPAFAIVAMPITIAAPKISDRTMVFSPIVEPPHIPSEWFGDERSLNVRLFSYLIELSRSAPALLRVCTLASYAANERGTVLTVGNGSLSTPSTLFACEAMLGSGNIARPSDCIFTVQLNCPRTLMLFPLKT
jgi:hypothetical protein